MFRLSAPDLPSASARVPFRLRSRYPDCHGVPRVIRPIEPTLGLPVVWKLQSADLSTLPPETEGFGTSASPNVSIPSLTYDFADGLPPPNLFAPFSVNVPRSVLSDGFFANASSSKSRNPLVRRDSELM